MALLKVLSWCICKNWLQNTLKPSGQRFKLGNYSSLYARRHHDSNDCNVYLGLSSTSTLLGTKYDILHIFCWTYGANFSKPDPPSKAWLVLLEGSTPTWKGAFLLFGGKGVTSTAAERLPSLWVPGGRLYHPSRRWPTLTHQATKPGSAPSSCDPADISREGSAPSSCAPACIFAETSTKCTSFDSQQSTAPLIAYTS